MLKRIYQQLFPEKRRINNRLLWNRLTSVFYLGKTYHCNCCNNSFRIFKSKGNTLTKRKNAECPYCGSLERTRNLLLYIENETCILTGKVRLLHFAPEWALVPVLKKAEKLEYITADLNPNLADYPMDITNIPFPDESFDYIICMHVLGHVPDEKKAVDELFRVLKSDGVALIATIIDRENPHTFETEDADTPEKRLSYYSEPDLLRLHGTDFDQRLMKSGFRVEVIDYPSQSGEKIKQKYSLGDGKRELIFKCTKD
ncbi:MAG: putative methyltransferase YcgJ [Candidatus Ordinivivax streblomastigis]|uniref:Putative methyltransferase YcgJ n=1 Tax=Candidatus Ordinivivax streblomastigis TaxID=2540710 RepID=A0A5M8P0K6_9BACT|nr:MAG: putative methyltransferase YcgJ [Candidatus Ordinivivax streblomastigis]